MSCRRVVCQCHGGRRGSLLLKLRKSRSLSVGVRTRSRTLSSEKRKEFRAENKTTTVIRHGGRQFVLRAERPRPPSATAPQRGESGFERQRPGQHHGSAP